MLTTYRIRAEAESFLELKRGCAETLLENREERFNGGPYYNNWDRPGRKCSAFQILTCLAWWRTSAHSWSDSPEILPIQVKQPNNHLADRGKCWPWPLALLSRGRCCACWGFALARSSRKAEWPSSWYPESPPYLLPPQWAPPRAIMVSIIWPRPW